MATTIPLATVASQGNVKNILVSYGSIGSALERPHQCPELHSYSSYYHSSAIATGFVGRNFISAYKLAMSRSATACTHAVGISSLDGAQRFPPSF